MQKAKYIITVTALIVALGGLLMGFDASVISGVVKFIEIEFELTKLELGWSVASLTLTSTLAMLIAGPLSDKFGRRGGHAFNAGGRETPSAHAMDASDMGLVASQGLGELRCSVWTIVNNNDDFKWNTVKGRLKALDQRLNVLPFVEGGHNNRQPGRYPGFIILLA
jgi:hypothetical protein